MHLDQLDQMDHAAALDKEVPRESKEILEQQVLYFALLCYWVSNNFLTKSIVLLGSMSMV